MRPGVPLLQLHGRLGQRARTETCAKFHTATMGAALIATDVAARGLDFSHVDWVRDLVGTCFEILSVQVFQLDCPESVETYQHRVGRTARMKAKGSSLLVLLPEEAGFLERLKAKKMEVQYYTILSLVLTWARWRLCRLTRTGLLRFSRSYRRCL